MYCPIRCKPDCKQAADCKQAVVVNCPIVVYCSNLAVSTALLCRDLTVCTALSCVAVCPLCFVAVPVAVRETMEAIGIRIGMEEASVRNCFENEIRKLIATSKK